MFGEAFQNATRPVTSRLTLSHFDFSRWREVSILHRLLAPFRSWRQGSWLLSWGDGIAWVFAAVLIALAPYASTAMIGWLLVACAGFWLLLTVSDRAEGWLTPVHIVIMVYWVAMVVATAFSPVKAQAVSGLIKLTLNIFFFMLLARVLRVKELRSGLILVYLLSALIVSVYGMRQHYFGAEALATWVDPESADAGVTRVYSYLKNPNLLAAYIMPAISLSGMAILAWPKWMSKALAAVMLLTNLGCLRYTFSRGGWLGAVAMVFGLIVLMVYWLNPRFSTFWRRWALPLLLGGTAALIVAAVAFVPSIQSRFMSIFAMRGDSSNDFRLNVYAAVFDMIKARPFTGIGPGNEAFNKIYPLYQRPRFTALSAYSIYFETAVEAGIIGILSFFWMLIVTFQQGWVQLGKLRQTLSPDGYWLIGAMTGMVGLLVQGTFDTVWYRPQISTLWWMLLAIVASFFVSNAETAQQKALPPAGQTANDPDMQVVNR